MKRKDPPGTTSTKQLSKKPRTSVPGVSSSSGTSTHAGNNEETLITSIRGTDLALGLRRIPAGFHAVVHHSNLKWRTDNKPVSVNNDVIEWHNPIPIPSDLSATISLTIHASSEFQPILGNGEQLRRLTITVGELLARSAKDLPFTFFPKDGDAISPCSSLSVTVKQWNCESNRTSSNLRCSTVHSRGQLEDSTVQGHRAFSCYRKQGKEEDLQRAIIYFERALNICPLDHPCRAAVQSNMATAKLIHCQINDTDASLEVPLMLYRNALATRPVGHPDRVSTLIQLAVVHLARVKQRQDAIDAAQAGALLREAMDLSSSESHEHRAAMLMDQLHRGHEMEPDPGHSQSSSEQELTSGSVNMDPLTLGNTLLRRFERWGRLADLQQAISVLEGFMRTISVWSHRYPIGLMNLGAAVVHRFECLGELGDLEDAISRFGDAVGLTPDGHPDKPAHLNNLGGSFTTRFRRLGELSDLEEAIARQRDAVGLTPDGHPGKSEYLNNLGISFMTRFERLGELSDLEEAISMQRDAVTLTPDGHPHKPVHLSNLGISIKTRFERLGELSDLEEAVSMQRDSVGLTPDGHPHKPGYLNNLGISIMTRFERLGELSDLEEGISMQRDAPGYLNSLGTSITTRFERLGELSDLEEAISMQRDAVSLTPDGHPHKLVRLNDLGNSFMTRFERLGELSDLEEATSRQRDAVGLTPDGHPDRPARLNSLGSSFMARFERLGELSDLEEGISRQRDAVGLTLDGHPHKPVYLNSLGISLKTRFERLGELSDLEEGISMQRDAVSLTPDGHPHKLMYLNSLGNFFVTRFEHLGELSDLEEAISMQRDAVGPTPDSHPRKVVYLNSLGGSFMTRFERLGELSDLEEGISMQRDVVGLIPDGHPHKPAYLNNLGDSFVTRFERLGELGDLEEAISMQRSAVSLTPDGHPDKPARLNNLGLTFMIRFERLGEPSDLEDGISRQRDAVCLALDGHPLKPAYLCNLGISIMTRFKHFGELSDLEEGISMQRDAVGLIPDSHPHKPGYLNNLGMSFRTRFQRLGELSDLEEGISTQRDAVDLTPDGHPDKPGYLNDLCRSFITRFNHLQEPGDLKRALVLSSSAACASTGPANVRFRASRTWICCADLLQHHSLLDAYSVAVGLLPQLAWIGHSLARRYRELIRHANVVREAAAAALDSGRSEIAVEWLEQGRSIVWGELFQLRSPYDELSSVHPDHARRLQELSATLEHASTIREDLSYFPLKQTGGAEHRESSQAKADRHRKLAIERDRLLQDIRSLPGFERFLLHKEFSQLRTSTRSGAVVILNAAETRCDALIVSAEVDHVIHVPLPNFTLRRCKGHRTALQNFIRQARGKPCDDRDGHPISDESGCEFILSTLWRDVVRPVLEALALSIPENYPSRIFWCPTGPFTFFPIHAAGHYDSQYSQPGHKVFDYVISSYIPTLSILASLPKSDDVSGHDLRLLAVPQPPSDGLRKLPGVPVELEHIRAAIKNSPSARATLLESSIGTVEEVLTLMKEADWVHFACHGVQDDINPTESGLCLANKCRLRVSDITALSRTHGGLAFLSACETAQGDEDLSDEAIHIAAGMLFARYGGVIGTMWAISDRVAPDLAKDIYEQLFQNGTKPDYRDAARALHNAIARLRDKNVPFKDWLPFIHVGL